MRSNKSLELHSGKGFSDFKVKLVQTPDVKKHTISEIVRGFKTFSSRQINQFRKTPGNPVWQRNYYEHIIRNQDALFAIRHYIQNNSLSWTQDQLHPQNPSMKIFPD